MQKKMLLNILYAFAIIFLIVCTLRWLWEISKLLLVIIQLILFIILIFIVVRIFVNWDNTDQQDHDWDKSGMVQLEDTSFSEAANTIKKNVIDIKNTSSSISVSDEDFF